MKTLTCLVTCTPVLLAAALCLAADVEPKKPELHQAIRRGDKSTIQTLLGGGASVKARDAKGNTPLLHAALYAEANTVKLLLDQGADPNAANDEGATPLMRAATDYAKVRLLLRHGADVKPKSKLGNTALMLAARSYGSARVVKLLLDRGADVNATNKYGATALMAASAAGDIAAVRLLLDHGANINADPAPEGVDAILGSMRGALGWAAFRDDSELATFLLSRGAQVNQPTVFGPPLVQAAWGGHAKVAKILLDHGATADQRDLVAGYTALHWAASAENGRADLVNLLLARGANGSAEGGQSVDAFLGIPQTPLMLARKRGQTPIVEALLTANAKEIRVEAKTRPQPRPRQLPDRIDSFEARRALERVIPRLQQTADASRHAFLKHVTKQNCVSCHQQYLPESAMSLARSRQLTVAGGAGTQQIAFINEGQEYELQALFHPEPAHSYGYALFNAQLGGRKANEQTDALIHSLAVIQAKDGRWFNNIPRPPIQAGDVSATALAVHALRHYPLPGRKQEFETRIQRARRWLEKVQPETNEERIYQLLGLAWSGQPTSKLARMTAKLIETQRTDGGWAQLAKLESDAYATGQALYALNQAAAMPADHPVYQSGLRFLLQTQLEDGTWYVRRRAFPFQPPMESGFPHGRDSWISAAASSWTALALALAVNPSPTTSPASPPTTTLASAISLKSPALLTNQFSKAESTGKEPVDFAGDIKPVLERSCVSCHGGEKPKGGFRMADRQALLIGGNRGEPAVLPGRSDDSPLVRFVSGQVEDMEMPPLAKRDKYPALTKEEIGRLRIWIDQQALWPKEIKLSLPNP